MLKSESSSSGWGTFRPFFCLEIDYKYFSLDCLKNKDDILYKIIRFLAPGV